MIVQKLRRLESLPNRYWSGFLLGVTLAVFSGLAAGCTLTMRDQPRYEPFEESAFYADRSSARPDIPDTVARGQLHLDEHLYVGRVNGAFAQTFPFTVTLEVLEHGQERFDIFCSPCHGMLGDGNGIVTEYGMRKPTSFHDPELRDEPAGYYFALISDGHARDAQLRIAHSRCGSMGNCGLYSRLTAQPKCRRIADAAR